MRIKGGPYTTIDQRVARRIQEAHGKHPNLGHEGLTTVLEQEGIRVDEGEFKRFVLANKLEPGPTARPSLAHVGRRWWWPWPFGGSAGIGDAGGGADGGDGD